MSKVAERDRMLRLEAQREAELQRQNEAAMEELSSMPFVQSSPVDLGVSESTMPRPAPRGAVPARQPSRVPVPNRTLAPEGEMGAGQGMSPPAPSGIVDSFLSLFKNGGQLTGGGELNLDPSSIWQNGSIFAPGEYEQSVQARNDAGISQADKLIAKMKANNAAHRTRLEQMAPPAQVMATRNMGKR